MQSIAHIENVQLKIFVQFFTKMGAILKFSCMCTTVKSSPQSQ